MKPKTQEGLYRSLFDNMLDGLAYCQMIFDKEGNPVDFRYIRINKSFEQLTGLKAVSGKKATEVLPWIIKSNPELFEIYGRVALAGEPERLETYVTPLARWFAISVYSPQKKFFVAVFQNITGRKEIEKNFENAKIAAQNVLEDLSIEKSKVEMARAKEEAILLSIGDGLLATDEKGKIMLINKAAEELLGKKSAEVTGHIFSEAIQMEDEKGADMPMEKHPVSLALASGATTSMTTAGPTYYYVRKNKTKFPVAMMVTPVILEGKVIGTIEIFRDITLEKDIDQAKSEFVSLASHQLRTPITAISWYSEMLLGEETGILNTKQKEYLNEVHHGNQRMIDLVNTLLSVSRIELGTFAIEAEAVDVSLVIADALEELQPQIVQKKLHIERDYKEGAGSVHSDPKLIRIVLENLLSNAVAYTPDEGTISIRIKQTDLGVHVEVEDNGFGIPQKEQPKIYTKFFRAGNAHIMKPDGIGLGLYIARTVMEALGGGIKFSSKEREGTIFSVDIPNRDMVKKKSKKD